MVMARRPHQRRLAEGALLRVGVAPRVEQQHAPARIARPGGSMSTVSPSPETALGFAPALSSSSIVAALPLTAASASGVMP